MFLSKIEQEAREKTGEIEPKCIIYHCLGKVWCLLTFIFLRPPITPRDKIVGWFGIILLEWYGLSSIDQTNPA